MISLKIFIMNVMIMEGKGTNKKPVKTGFFILHNIKQWIFCNQFLKYKSLKYFQFAGIKEI